jgi:hypothetical protein
MTVREFCLRLWEEDDISPQEIAERTHIPVEVITRWVMEVIEKEAVQKKKPETLFVASDDPEWKRSLRSQYEAWRARMKEGEITVGELTTWVE